MLCQQIASVQKQINNMSALAKEIGLPWREVMDFCQGVANKISKEKKTNEYLNSSEEKQIEIATQLSKIYVQEKQKWWEQFFIIYSSNPEARDTFAKYVLSLFYE